MGRGTIDLRGCYIVENDLSFWGQCESQEESPVSDSNSHSSLSGQQVSGNSIDQMDGKYIVLILKALSRPFILQRWQHQAR